MASHIYQRPVPTQNENSEVKLKKTLFDENVNNTKTTAKRGNVALGTRKALNDITNKTLVRQESSRRKKNILKEEIDIAQEGFIHDHDKCIEEQQATRNTLILDMVLPGHELASTTGRSQVKEAKVVPDCLSDPDCHLELLDLPTDWFSSSTQWQSPPCSPICLNSAPCPFSWQFEMVEFKLKEEDAQI